MSSNAKHLVNTSVQDMQSGLWQYKVEDLPVLREALKIVEQRGEKTKVRILSAKIKKLEKEVQ